MTLMPERKRKIEALVNLPAPSNSVTARIATAKRNAAIRDLLAELPEWRPIETAPKDGTYILVCNHDAGVSWVAKYCDRFTSGYRPDNPWMSMMLNRRHAKKRYPSSVPTHWQPLPEPPHG